MNTSPIIPSLTEVEKERIFELVENLSVIQASGRLSAPPPMGIGRRLSPATLWRLRRQFRLEKHLDSCEESRAAAAIPAGGDFLSASFAALSEKAFQLTLSEKPADLQIAARILAQLARTRASLGPARPTLPETPSASIPSHPAPEPGAPSPVSAAPTPLPALASAAPSPTPSATPLVPPAPPAVDDAFRQRVARHALLHHAELGSIRNNPGLSETRKLELIAARLFPSPAPGSATS